MKKIFKIYFTFVFAIFTLITCSEIYGASYITDYIDINKEIAFETEEFILKSECKSYYDTNNDEEIMRLEVSGKYKNEAPYNCHYIVYYYNENNEEIGKSYDNNVIRTSADSVYSANVFTEDVNEAILANSQDVSDIKKYKIFIEPESNEIVQTTFQGENTALSTVKDNNTSLMKEIDVFEFEKTSLGYYIDSYDIKMVVNDDNTFDITETITAYFNESRHGIFRKLPLRNTVERVDGTSSKNIAKISKIDVNEKYTKYNENGYKVIKIGDEDVTLTGEKEYVISYKYNIGKDPLKYADELYFNLIGDEWDTSIDNVTFTIEMPKEFDGSKLGFSVGYSGSTNNEGVEYQVNGNVITGKYNDVLDSYEGLTVRLELPKDYFVGASLNLDWPLILAFVIPIVCVFVIVIMWLKKGKDDVVVETVEFYPPKGYNSAEVGFMYKGKVDNQGVISLLIELANKGYIKIIEEDKEGKKKNSFKIVKVKEYDGTDVNERTFFNGLFEKKQFDIEAFSNIKGLKDMVGKTEDDFTKTIKLEEATADDLTDSFYITIDKIKENINSKKNKDKIFEKGSLRRTLMGIFMLVSSFILTTSVVLYGKAEEGDLFTAIMMPLILGTMTCVVVFATRSIIVTLIMLGFDFAGVIGVCQLLFPVFQEDSIYLILYILTIICICVIGIFTKIMPKRTKFGIEMIGKIGGFKNFLEVARKEELEALVEKNPEYFYDILPYTYALGVSDKWIEKFEGIAIKPAKWCESSSMRDNFSITTFGKFMDDTMSTAHSSMSSRPSSSGGSGGGGSSGGGSSGGGSGGGGGGSW